MTGCGSYSYSPGRNWLECVTAPRPVTILPAVTSSAASTNGTALGASPAATPNAYGVPTPVSATLPPHPPPSHHTRHRPTTRPTPRAGSTPVHPALPGRNAPKSSGEARARRHEPDTFTTTATTEPSAWRRAPARDDRTRPRNMSRQHRRHRYRPHSRAPTTPNRHPAPQPHRTQYRPSSTTPRKQTEPTVSMHEPNISAKGTRNEDSDQSHPFRH
jgi:hypothetical protein